MSDLELKVKELNRIDLRLSEIEKELMPVKNVSYAISSIGSVGGLIYGVYHKKGFFKTIGIMILGGMITAIPANIYYSKVANLGVEKERLLAKRRDLEFEMMKP